MSQLTRFTASSGPGSGTVTSISAGTGITLTPNPITTTGTVALTVPVSIANGGTNAITMATTDGTVYFDGTRLVTTATGTSTQVLTSNGAGVAPTYQSIGGSFANSFPTDSGTATPSAGALTIAGGLNLTTTGAASTVTVKEKTFRLLNNYSVANASPYVVASTAYYITVDTTTIPITIRLPDAPTQYQYFIIKDSGGLAATNNISVTTVSGLINIDASTTYTMNTNYAAIQVVYSGFGYEVF